MHKWTVFGYPVCLFFSGGMAVFLSGVFQGALACPCATAFFLGLLLVLTVHGSLVVSGVSVGLCALFVRRHSFLLCESRRLLGLSGCTRWGSVLYSSSLAIRYLCLRFLSAAVG